MFSPEGASTVTTGFVKARLDRLHTAQARHVRSGAVPAVVSAVSRDGEVRLDVIGSLSTGGPPVTERSIFRIASLSKPVTAVAAMILVEDGVLRLDDPVEEFLPELGARRVLRSLESDVEDTVPAARPIVVRDLLTFRTGYGMILAMPGTYPIQGFLEERFGAGGAPQPWENPEPDVWMSRWRDVPLLHQPGEQWTYNTSADLLSVLIARASGRPLEVFLSERVLEPLGMGDTGFSVPEQHLDRFTTSYTPTDDGLQVFDDARSGQWAAPPAFPSGAGGLVSTVPDFLRFAQMMVNGGSLGGERILARTTVEAMGTNQLTQAQRAATRWIPGYFDDWGWGLGVAVRTRRTGPESPGQYGWDGGMGTTWYVDPRERLTGVQFTNVNWTAPMQPAVCRDFWTAAYQAVL
jgi:CubicO group peptidase (beta-lactamase class C family)